MAYDKRKATAALMMMDKKRREPATVTRARMYGTANQMAHEQQGRMERQALKDKMAEGKKNAMKRGGKKRSPSKEGTAGSGLRSTFFGM